MTRTTAEPVDPRMTWSFNRIGPNALCRVDGGAHWWKGAVMEVAVRAANPLEASMRRQRLTISDLMVATGWKASAASRTSSWRWPRRTGRIAFSVRSPDHTETDAQSGAPEPQIPG